METIIRVLAVTEAVPGDTGVGRGWTAELFWESQGRVSQGGDPGAVLQYW